MIAVVHLVWGPLGAAPLRRFAQSLRAHPPGSEHELVLLMNGVDARQRGTLLTELEGIEHRCISIADPVQDLLAYRYAAERLDQDRLCFVNSYSVIMANDWLAKLDVALAAPDVGAVGATGSWASLRSLTLNGLRLPSAYRPLLPLRPVAFEQMQDAQAELQRGRGEDASSPAAGGLAERVRLKLAMFAATAEQIARFPGFPDPHLRSNGFLIGRELFLSLRIARVRRKMDAYELESGRRSITSQIRGIGLRAALVDSTGASHEESRWPHSHTFWQADQERLLLADNQTGIYQAGSIERRRVLAALAWGAEGKPQEPETASASLVPAPETDRGQ